MASESQSMNERKYHSGAASPPPPPSSGARRDGTSRGLERELTPTKTLGRKLWCITACAGVGDLPGLTRPDYHDDAFPMIPFEFPAGGAICLRHLEEGGYPLRERPSSPPRPLSAVSLAPVLPILPGQTQRQRLQCRRPRRRVNLRGELARAARSSTETALSRAGLPKTRRAHRPRRTCRAQQRTGL